MDIDTALTKGVVKCKSAGGLGFSFIDAHSQHDDIVAYRAKHKGSDSFVAVKSIPMKSGRREDTSKALEALRAQLKSAGADDSGAQCVLPVYGAFLIGSTRLYLVSEWYEYGTVADLMFLSKHGLTETQLGHCCRRILMALSFLHAHEHVHGDVKAQNVVVCGSFDVKLVIDQPVATAARGGAQRDALLSLPYWLAPEIIKESALSISSDVWALGITCIEMAEMHPPHYDVHPMRAVFKIATAAAAPQLAVPASPDLSDFVAQCLTLEVERRATVADLLAHPFMEEAMVSDGSSLVEIVQEAQAGINSDEVGARARALGLPAPQASAGGATVPDGGTGSMLTPRGGGGGDGARDMEPIGAGQTPRYGTIVLDELRAPTRDLLEFAYEPSWLESDALGKDDLQRLGALSVAELRAEIGKIELELQAELEATKSNFDAQRALLERAIAET